MASKTFWIRAGVSAGAIGGIMLSQWLEVDLLHWIGLTFYAVCLLMFLQTLIRSLVKMKKITADLLVVTVLIVAFLDGQPLSGVVVAWFISLGLAISLTIIERTRSRIAALTKKQSKIVRVEREGVLKKLPIEDVLPGDIVSVPQGEMIPVDGVVIEGEGLVDESVVTGEPFPVYKIPGEAVISGSLSLSGALRIQSSRAGDKAFLYTMNAEIQKALQVKTKTHKTADKIVQFFIPGVVLYSLLVYLITGDLGRMATVVSIACPCAWALATPTAFAAAIGCLAGQGILARGGTPLEVIGEASAIVLDKTGTVTLAEPHVESVMAITMPEELLLQRAASIEAGFNHPIANAIVSYAVEHNASLLEVEERTYLPGQGVKAIVQGDTVFLGATKTVQEAGFTPPQNVELDGRATWVVVNNQLAGAILIQDVLREYAHGLADELHKLGINRVVLATGDTEEGEARRVAAIIGADEYHWQCTPGDKTVLIETLKAQGVTVMVGDGINDATSLGTADVGIAMGGSKADLAIQSSDIIVQREDANSLLVVLETGKKLQRIIRQNYSWAMGFNTVGILLATMGVLSPPLAAIFHHISSVFVVSNSARLLRKSSLGKSLM